MELVLRGRKSNALTAIFLFLATVNTSALNKYLKSKIREVRPDVDHGFWIGGHRASKDGVWKWTDGRAYLVCVMI